MKKVSLSQTTNARPPCSVSNNTNGRTTVNGLETDHRHDLDNTYTVDGIQGEDAELKRNGYSVNSKSFQARISSLIRMTEEEHPDLEPAADTLDSSILAPKHSDSADSKFTDDMKTSDTSIIDERQDGGGAQFLTLPLHITRIFHPRPALHAGMSEMIKYWMAEHRASQLGLDIVPIYFDLKTSVNERDKAAAM